MPYGGVGRLFPFVALEPVSVIHVIPRAVKHRQVEDVVAVEVEEEVRAVGKLRGHALLRYSELNQTAGVRQLVVAHGDAEHWVRAAPAARADEYVAFAVELVVLLAHGARDLREVRLLAVNFRVDVDYMLRPLEPAVRHHAVAAQYSFIERHVRDAYLALVVVDGERAHLHQREAVVRGLVGELHIDGKLQLLLEERQQLADAREELRAAARQLREGEDRARRVHVARVRMNPVEGVVVEPLEIGLRHAVLFDDVAHRVGDVLGGEALLLEVYVVVVLLRVRHNLVRLRPLGAQVRIRQIEGARVGPVHRARAEAEADARDAVVLLDARRRAAENLGEGRARELGVEHLAVLPSRDGLDEHRHTLAPPLDAVLALILARRGVVGRGVDLLYRGLELRAPLLARAGVRREACRVLARERKLHVVLERGRRAHAERRLDKVEDLLERLVERVRQPRLGAGLVDNRAVRVRAQIFELLPEIVNLHELVEYRRRYDEGVIRQMHVVRQAVLRQNEVGERKPLRLPADAPVADEPAALLIIGVRIETLVILSVVHKIQFLLTVPAPSSPPGGFKNKTLSYCII